MKLVNESISSFKTLSNKKMQKKIKYTGGRAFAAISYCKNISNPEQQILRAMAEIQNFTKDFEKMPFMIMSLPFLMRATCIKSKTTIIKHLKSLIVKGYILKLEVTKREQILKKFANSYKITQKVFDEYVLSENYALRVKALERKHLRLKNSVKKDVKKSQQHLNGGSPIIGLQVHNDQNKNNNTLIKEKFKKLKIKAKNPGLSHFKKAVIAKIIGDIVNKRYYKKGTLYAKASYSAYYSLIKNILERCNFNYEQLLEKLNLLQKFNFKYFLKAWSFDLKTLETDLIAYCQWKEEPMQEIFVDTETTSASGEVFITIPPLEKIPVRQKLYEKLETFAPQNFIEFLDNFNASFIKTVYKDFEEMHIKKFIQFYLMDWKKYQDYCRKLA